MPTKRSLILTLWDALLRHLGKIWVFLMCCPALGLAVILQKSWSLARRIPVSNRVAYFSEYLPFYLGVMICSLGLYMTALIMIRQVPTLINFRSPIVLTLALIATAPLLLYFPGGWVLGVFGVITFLEVRRIQEMVKSR